MLGKVLGLVIDKAVLRNVVDSVSKTRITNLPFDYSKKNYLNATDVQQIIALLEKYGESLYSFPPNLNQYANFALEFINSILPELKSYIELLEKINSEVTSRNVADFKKEINNLYGRIKVLCDNRELAKYTARYYNQLLKDSNLVGTVDNYIGDFALKFSEFLDKANLNGLNETNISLRLVGQNKDVLRQGNGNLEKLKRKVLSWLNGKVLQFAEPITQNVALDTVLFRPIESYTFGPWLDFPTVNACITIMNSYISTLNSYPFELLEYKRDCLDIIRFVLPKLKDYNTALGSLAKPDLSDKQIIDLKTKLYRILILLKKKFEPVLKEGNITYVMNVCVNNGENLYLPLHDDGERIIHIDGWSMGDFLTPLLGCVNNTIEDLNNLINPAKAEGKIDYVNLGIKEPPKSTSKLKKAGKAVRNFFSGSKNETSVFIKNRKTLISYVEKAQKLYNDANSLNKKVRSLKKLLGENQVPVEEGSFDKRVQEINDRFLELELIYNRIACGKGNFYLGLEVHPELIKNGKINVSSSIVPPIWTPEKCTLLADYISRDLDEMQELYNDLAENVQDLLRIYSGTVSSIIKERSKLSAMLQMVIDIKNDIEAKINSIKTDFSKWKSVNFDVFFDGSVPTYEEIWVQKQEKDINEAYNSINGVYKWFRSAAIPLSSGGILDKLEFISENGKINTTTLNGISLSQFKDVVGFISKRLDVMRENLSKLMQFVENLKKIFEKRKKDYISERYKLEKLLKKSIDVVKKSYKYTSECAAIAMEINSLPNNNDLKKALVKQYEEVVVKCSVRDTLFGSICDYKPDPNNSSVTYTLIDDKNKIGSDIKKLNLDLLRGAIKNCSEALKDLENSAKEVLKNEEALCKEYKKLKAKIR